MESIKAFVRRPLPGKSIIWYWPDGIKDSKITLTKTQRNKITSIEENNLGRLCLSSNLGQWSSLSSNIIANGLHSFGSLRACYSRSITVLPETAISLIFIILLA